MLMVSMIHPIVSMTFGLSIKSFRQFVSKFWPKKYKIKSTILKRLMTFSINVYLALIGMIIYYLILMDICLLKGNDYGDHYNRCYCDGSNSNDPKCNDPKLNLQHLFVQFSIDKFTLAFSLVSLACHVIHSLTIAIPPPIPMIDFILGSEKSKDEEDTQSIEMTSSPKNKPELEIQVEDSKCKIGWSICFKVSCCILLMMFVGFVMALPYVNFGNDQCQASNKTNSSKTCQTNDNKDCVFPFVHHDQVFYGCSKTDNEDIHYSMDKDVRTYKAWCATDTNFEIFDICKENCPGGKFEIHK